MTAVRCGVIGVGHLGKFHAQKYSNIENCKLVALADPNPNIALTLSKELNCKYVKNYKEILNDIDLVSIVAPTPLHYEITSEVLKSGKGVLLEKPITETVKEAKLLDKLAKKNNLILQIGHLERFNPALLKLKEILDFDSNSRKNSFNPIFIEATRISSYKPRATDVDVIIDLMIHDIDLILEMVNSPIKKISAKGAIVISKTFDIANARLEFENGCVANITSSRVSEKTERKMRIFTNDIYYSLDFQNKHLKSTSLKNKETNLDNNLIISSKKHIVDPTDALETEINKFINSYIFSSPVAVSASDAVKALETATLITERIQESVI